jgi:phosphoribosylformylglycinamidine synthase
MRPRALIPTGFGINCEVETAHAFRLAGADAQLLHFNDLAAEPATLARAHILVLAGGFSFGDHLGAGRALANRIRRRLGHELRLFIADGGLVLGICNGFQTLTRLGLVPGGVDAPQTAALGANQRGTFYDGWVTLAMDAGSPCVFTRGMETLEVPVRHGEGRLLCSSTVRDDIARRHLAPVRYADPDTGVPSHRFPQNPNGSEDAIAGLCDPTGRIFGLMPHPEAFLYFENHPRWRRRQRTSEAGDGLQVFRNAVEFAARG